MAIYRMKGVLHIAGEEQLHVLQAVHDTFDIKPSSFARGASEDKSGGESKVIVIGRNLDASRLYQGIKDCATT